MSGDYDVTVIGAGIHGAGVAQAAAAHGYRTLVLEATSVAGATSSRSSKLIHGGLRYLEQAQLGLVRECLRERELLLRLAPELVRLRSFRIPVYRATRRRPWQLRAGLSLYALLAGLGAHARFRSLPRRSWNDLDGLDTRRLQAVFEYQDGQTDDAALTRAVLHSAVSLGAELRLPARFTGAERHADGVQVAYSEGGKQRSCTSRVLVNAAGPWVAEVSKLIRPAPPPISVDLVQGCHLLLDIPARACIYYLEVPEDGRAVFLMPWQGMSLLGTTETLFDGADPASVTPRPEERQYLVRLVQHYFPQTPFKAVNAFAGLRVLPRDSARPFERGRELILQGDAAHKPRVLGLYGGKLTSYRADAEKVLARLLPALPRRNPVADTRRLPLQPAG
ncbi:MAG TPA: FAD-dependent oxidoreductase [Gammaproteobacteria bacterium]|nr:FAD-dependent oxidoreductase [Gammaproteobacteria bacterium]